MDDQSTIAVNVVVIAGGFVGEISTSHEGFSFAEPTNGKLVFGHRSHFAEPQDATL